MKKLKITDVASIVSEVLTDELGVRKEDITAGSTLKELGADSIDIESMAFNFEAAIEDKLDTDINFENEIKTSDLDGKKVGQIVSTISNKLKAKNLLEESVGHAR